jgi:hypothetical protein
MKIQGESFLREHVSLLQTFLYERKKIPVTKTCVFSSRKDNFIFSSY